MKRIILSLATLVTLPAWAEEHGRAVPLTPTYKSECGSCHTPFPPGLLRAADWKTTMAGLDKHFGTDASLDAKTAAEISAWLAKNAGGRASTGSAEPRITTTTWFKREHREVSAKTWQDSRVKSAANCAACHKGADQGRYGEREINVPGAGRYRDRD